jgi:hypothetical protein
MTSEGLGEMFEGDSADTGAGEFPLVSMGGRAEGLTCADPGARTPIGASGNLKYYLLCVQFYLPPSNIWVVVYDGMPCLNMIGQKEDRLLHPNTGQAFSIDTISQETSRLAS